MTESNLNVRAEPDRIMVDIAEYALQRKVGTDLAYDTARYCLMDTLGCGLEALGHPECVKLLGPVVPGTIVPNGAKVPGTGFQLDPVQAAFSLGAMIRWLDYNDTWLAAEPCHPSDNLAGILSTADYLSRLRVSGRQPPLVMRDVLTAMIKAYEIQGVLALENSFTRVGLDHVILVKIASTAVVTALLGGTPYGSHIIENVLFKIAYPAGFHAQSAVECAIQLHPLVRDRLSDIDRIELDTHRACIGVLAKTGPLHNFADRDHCVQYMAAIGLLRGALESSDYEDAAAADPRIDRLRELMVVKEEARYTRDFYDPEKRSNSNAITVIFKDDSRTPRVEVEYPLGHARRRKDGIPLLLRKFKVNLARRYPAKQQAAVLELCMDRKRLESTPVHEFVDLLAAPCERDGAEG